MHVRRWIQGSLGVLIAGLAALATGSADAALVEKRCPVSLEVTSVATGGGCWIDAPPKGATASAAFLCGGGPIAFTLGKHGFSGTVEGGMLNATATSTFEFSDGCSWVTTQRVSGSLASGKLAYGYSERVAKGRGCASACTASGIVAVK